MLIEPFFIIGLLVVFGCFVLIVISVVVLYFRTSKALSALNTEFVLYKRDHEQKAREALLVATKKAEEIISSTQIFSNETKKWVMDAVSKSVINGSNTYEQIISDLGKKSVSDFISYSDTLKKSIEAQTTNLTDSYKKQLEVEESTFHNSLEKNQESILLEIKSRAASLLTEVVKDSVSRSLTKEEAEDLVLTGLNKIKKSHGF